MQDEEEQDRLRNALGLMASGSLLMANTGPLTGKGKDPVLFSQGTGHMPHDTH